MNLFSQDESDLPAPPAPAEGVAPKPAPPLVAVPLAARMRPQTFDEFVGQVHLVGPGAPLRRAVESDHLPSAILSGPAGTGKTSLARLLAELTSAHFEDFSAVTGNVAQVRQIVAAAAARLRPGIAAPRRTLLFVDEIHRFNRAQQDAFLPHVEEGTIILLGATTENPLASLNSPLLSRCRLFALQPLQDEELEVLLRRALGDERGLGPMGLAFEAPALTHLARCAAGDARLALGALEMAADLARASGTLTLADAEAALGRRTRGYDLTGESHYDMISAYIKSLRGSDPDAALYWMSRMLEGGEDALFIARRLVIQASEDVGNADPMALVLATAALAAVQTVGLPEAAIPLAQATLYVATAAKSNAAYEALKRARAWLREAPLFPVPAHLRSSALPGSGARTGAGIGYQYPHAFPGHFVPQEYLTSEVPRPEPFYRPSDQGLESEIGRRLINWQGQEPG